MGGNNFHYKEKIQYCNKLKKESFYIFIDTSFAGKATLSKMNDWYIFPFLYFEQVPCEVLNKLEKVCKLKSKVWNTEIAETFEKNILSTKSGIKVLKTNQKGRILFVKYNYDEESSRNPKTLVPDTI